MYLGGRWTGLIRYEEISIGSAFSISLNVGLFRRSFNMICPLLNTLQYEMYILKNGYNVISSEEISVFRQCHLFSTDFKNSSNLVLNVIITSTLGNRIAC